MRNLINRLSVIVILILIINQGFCQIPQLIPYQSVIRNSEGNLVTNKQIGLRFSILDGGAAGNAVYTENATVTTNDYGLFTATIGAGIPLDGNTFSGINWASGAKFIKTEADIDGNGYIALGEPTQLMSVPYALVSQLPKMTSDQMNAIVNPLEGFTIYNTTVKALCYYNTQWNCMDKQSISNDNFLCGNPLQDLRDGQVYKTVKIGSQCWMAENLNALKYNNRDDIPLTNFEVDSGSYFHTANRNIYGLLYTWYAAVDNRGLCPLGWHMPTVDDFGNLEDCLGINGNGGGRLKEVGTDYWKSPNTNANNSSGFSARPAGGFANIPFVLNNAGYSAYFLTVSETINEFGEPGIAGRSLNSGDNYFGLVTVQKNWYLSIRCLKDQ